MKIKELLILYMLFGSVAPLFSQEPTDNISIEDLREIYKTDREKDQALIYQTVKMATEGSPFLNKEFLPGQLRLKKKSGRSDTLNINIDLEKNFLLFEMSDGTYGFLPNSLLAEIRLFEPNAFVFRPYPSGFVEGNQDFKLKLYEVLYDEQITVLKKYNRYLDEPDVQDQRWAGRDSNKYRTRLSYYIRVRKGQRFEKIKLNKKGVVKVLSPHYDNVSKLIKDQKLSLNSESELIDLLKKLE